MKLDEVPIVLRNKGVAIKLARLDENNEQIVDDNDEIVTETIWIKFTLNKIAALEERYSTINAWQLAMAEQSYQAARATLAVLLNTDEETIGARMIVTEVETYLPQIGAAWGIANGVDPIDAEKSLRQIISAAKKVTQALRDQIHQEANTEMDGSLG